MRVRAFAKINLSLRIVGARGDGFHDLRTIFQSIALHDTLTIRRTRGALRVTSDDPTCPAGRANLVWRAAERMWRAARARGAPQGVAIDLRKRIPMNAGLGGGSSDAAAAIRALARLWRVDPSRARAVGRELGADVAYFFEGGTALGLDRGDLLFPLVDHPPAFVVLVLPGFGVSTKEAYAWFDADAAPARVTRRADLVNDLQPPVARRHPEIPRIVGALARAGASHAAMTGSGSTVFGLFASRRAADRAARDLASRSRQTRVTTTLNREQYQRLAGP